MKPVSTFQEVQKALQELFNFRDTFRTRDQDLAGKRIRNAAPAIQKGDYVTLEQIPTVQETPQILYSRYYSIPWSIDGTPTITDEVVKFPVGNGREGIPHQVILTARNAPSGGPLTINLNVRTIDAVTDLDVDTEILNSDLSLPDGETRRVYSSKFISGIQNLQNLSEAWPVIKAVNGASGVTIVLVVKLF